MATCLLGSWFSVCNWFVCYKDRARSHCIQMAWRSSPGTVNQHDKQKIFSAVLGFRLNYKYDTEQFLNVLPVVKACMNVPLCVPNCNDI